MKYLVYDNFDRETNMVNGVRWVDNPGDNNVLIYTATHKYYDHVTRNYNKDKLMKIIGGIFSDIGVCDFYMVWVIDDHDYTGKSMSIVSDTYIVFANNIANAKYISKMLYDTDMIVSIVNERLSFIEIATNMGSMVGCTIDDAYDILRTISRKIYE